LFRDGSAAIRSGISQDESQRGIFGLAFVSRVGGDGRRPGVADREFKRGKHGCEDQTAWEVAGKTSSPRQIPNGEEPTRALSALQTLA